MVSQRTLSVELTAFFRSFAMRETKYTENTKRDESTLRLVSFVKPLCARCGKKSCGSVHKVPERSAGFYDFVLTSLPL